LGSVCAALAKKDAGKAPAEQKVPWTGFDLINAFNHWKHSEAAGLVDGKPGLPWQHEVCAQVFEEALVDLGRALGAYSASKRGQRRGQRMGFPVFKKKGRSRDSFRLRNKTGKGKAPIRLGDQGPRSITLPKLGCIGVRQCTRRLRRMLRSKRCLIMFATVFAHRGKWHVRLNGQAQPLTPRCPPGVNEPLGIDRGLCTFAVAATADGQHQQTLTSPRPLTRRLRRLRRLSRALSRKEKGSRNRRKHAVKLGKFHGRIRDIRHDFLHRASTDLVKIHAHVVLEDLNTSGLMRNRCLARAIADSGWAMFAKNVTYKAQWTGRTVTVADRFYPSSKRCSVCGSIAAAVPLSVRQFTCTACGNRLDRDLNAARNLAQWPLYVAGKPPEAQNACGGRRAGQRAAQTLVKRLPLRQEREKSRAPEKGGVGDFVNML